MQDLAKTLQAFFLDSTNNAKTTDNICLEHDLSHNEVLILLGIGKKIHEDRTKITAMTNKIRQGKV